MLERCLPAAAEVPACLPVLQISSLRSALGLQVQRWSPEVKAQASLWPEHRMGLVSAWNPLVWVWARDGAWVSGSAALGEAL